VSAPIRLLIVDDHEVVRAGLRALFGTVARVEVIGEAEDTAGAVEAVRNLGPDVVLMDVRLGEESGVDACRAILAIRPTARVILLSAFSDEVAAAEALRAGAVGYLLKRSSVQAVIRAVKGVGGPEAILDVEVALRLVGATAVRNEPAHLTEHERELARLVALGLTNHEIAERMQAPEATVKAQVSRLLAHLDLTHRAEVAARLANLERDGIRGERAAAT